MELKTTNLVAQVAEGFDLEDIQSALASLSRPVSYTDGEKQIRFSPVSEFSLNYKGELVVVIKHLVEDETRTWLEQGRKLIRFDPAKIATSNTWTPDTESNEQDYENQNRTIT